MKINDLCQIKRILINRQKIGLFIIILVGLNYSYAQPSEKEQELQKEFQDDYQNIDNIMKEVEQMAALLLQENQNPQTDDLQNLENIMQNLKIDMDNMEKKWKDIAEKNDQKKQKTESEDHSKIKTDSKAKNEVHDL